MTETRKLHLKRCVSATASAVCLLLCLSCGKKGPGPEREAPENAQTTEKKSPETQTGDDKPTGKHAGEDQSPEKQTSGDQSPEKQTSGDQSPEKHTGEDQPTGKQADETAALPISDMTEKALKAHLKKKAEAYTPPDAALKVLPFDPSDWKTNTAYPLIGDPEAKKGGTITFVWNSFPPNLRTDGPNANLIQTSTLHSLIYESLLSLHPETLEFIPSLATHWKISDDKQTFHFRLNPKARFSNGSEVTSDDIYWSFRHLVQEDRKDPYNTILFEKSFNMPVIIDKYTVKVTTKNLNWRLFMYFASSMMLFPAEYIHISGEEYLNGYQWDFPPGTGPYIMKPGDLEKPSSLRLTRRTNWWAEDQKWADGLYNFDTIRFFVVTERKLEFQKFKHKELDLYYVTKAQRWVEECNFNAVKNGWIKKRRIKTEAAQGFNGFCFNMRKKPFNNINVRKAWAYLFNREKLMKELFFNQYDFIESCYPGRVWANPGNPGVRYNPRKAAALLKEAGYTKRNSEGILIGPDGKPFEVTLEITQETMKRVFTPVVKDYKKAGIAITLKQIDPRTRIKKVSDRQFLVTYQWWGALSFPNPESSWMSDLADRKNNNNLPGFKNPIVDKLCKRYNVCFDQEERIKIIRQIDGIICSAYPYAFGWYSNKDRILYWDKFGHPESYFSRTGLVSQSPHYDILALWWFDPAKKQRLDKAMNSGEKLKQGEVEIRPWDAPDAEES